MAPAARDSVTVRAGDGEPGPAERRREAAEGAGETGGGLPLREIPRVTNHFPPHSKEEEKNLGLRSSSSANTAASELEASPPAAFPSPPLVVRRPGARAEPAVPGPPRCWSGQCTPSRSPRPAVGKVPAASPPASGLHQTLQRPSRGLDAGPELRTARPAAAAEGARPRGIAAGFPAGALVSEGRREPWATSRTPASVPRGRVAREEATFIPQAPGVSLARDCRSDIRAVNDAGDHVSIPDTQRAPGPRPRELSWTSLRQASFSGGKSLNFASSSKCANGFGFQSTETQGDGTSSSVLSLT